jgi:phosphoribosylformylglycinamidine (FGAM) synthase-like amidotransferase family enzyme
MPDVVDMIEDKMERCLRGEKVDFKGPGFTYGDAVRNGWVDAARSR